MQVWEEAIREGATYWVIDFRDVRSHQKGMPLPKIRRFLPITCFLFCGGCAHLNHTPQHLAAQHPKEGLRLNLSRWLVLFHPFDRKTAPPKAVALLTVGKVRTVSLDGSYVIAELEPGAMVAEGNNLLVTENRGETAHLKVAEINFPFFLADIEHGHPEPGDILRQ